MSSKPPLNQQCNHPGCFRTAASPIHSTSTWGCARCRKGGHPFWRSWVSVDNYAPHVDHHAFERGRGDRSAAIPLSVVEGIIDEWVGEPDLPGVTYD